MAEVSEVATQVMRHRDGDAAAGEWLARRACRLALRTAAAILRGREEAGDVAQDVAVDVLLALPRLRDAAAFDAWVHRIAVRHTLRALASRRDRHHAETTLDELHDEAPLAVPIPGADLNFVLSTRDALGSALSRLPAKQQVALALRYVHDLPDREIAAALECRVGSVHALLSRGRASLRQDPVLRELSNERSGV